MTKNTEHSKIHVSPLKTKAHKDIQEVNDEGCLHMGRNDGGSGWKLDG